MKRIPPSGLLAKLEMFLPSQLSCILKNSSPIQEETEKFVLKAALSLSFDFFEIFILALKGGLLDVSFYTFQTIVQ